MENKYEELYEKLSHLQWLLGRRHMRNHFEHGPFADPTRGQGRVLAMLKLQPEITTRDLSYLLGIRQQSLNELLNKLEKSEYVRREPSEADKRVMMVKLTEKGKAGQQERPDYSGIFDCLSPEEQETFGDYLDRVITELEAQLGTEADEEEIENWIESARSRMGSDMFERMMSRGGRFGLHGHGPAEPGFHGRFSPGGRGPGPEEIPGAKGPERSHEGPFRADVPITATESITKALTITILSEAPGDSDEE